MEYKLGFLSLLFSTFVVVFFVATLSPISHFGAWLYTFPILTTIHYIFYQSWIYPFYISPLRHVPTVSGFPLWGQTLASITEEVGVPQRRWHKEHGPILRYFLLFGRARLSVIDDEALKQITVRNPYVWEKPAISKNFMGPILGEGVLLAEGDTHVQLRREIQQHMSFLFNPQTRNDETHLSSIDEDRLPYLNNICRESFRYIPPIPFTVRQNSAEDHLSGYRIPARTMVFMYSNTINRAPRFWGDDADIFDPDRWDRLPGTYTPNAYMTFLHGPRGCIGKKFAETEMKMLLCCLLSMYRFEVDEGVEDPEDWKMWRITLRPRDGVTLKVSLLE